MSELDDVLRAATMAADGAFIAHRDGTNAARVRVAVRAAFECALGNGLIQITDPAGWPRYLSIDPPYTVTAWAATARACRDPQCRAARLGELANRVEHPAEDGTP